MGERKGDWMTTYSGRQFWPLDPWPDDVCLEDIAHALSNQCRFAGHCRVHYSVAEHSLLVASLVQGFASSDETVKAALLHDAAEAYLTDIPRPLKRQRAFDEYRAHEKILEAVIYEHFGIRHGVDHDAIEIADSIALLVEMRALMPAPMVEWTLAQKKHLPEKYHALVETTRLPFEAVREKAATLAYEVEEAGIVSRTIDFCSPMQGIVERGFVGCANYWGLK